MAILIKDGAAWLPLSVAHFNYYLGESREAMGWKIHDFVERAQRQIDREEAPPDKREPAKGA